MPSLSPQAASKRLTLLLALGVLTACGDNALPDDDLTAIHAPEIARIVPASEALAGVHIPTLDLAPLNDAEIGKALGAGPFCVFRYTTAGKPVLAWEAPVTNTAKGVVKLNGHLVLLQPASTTGAQLVLAADRIRVIAAPDADTAERRQGEATVVFEIGDRLKAGYRGYYTCAE